MRDTMLHRGPDDAGVHLSGGFGMGARRLSIIDLEGGRQPVSNEDGSVWAIHNGEIYNFRELREDLIAKGHLFRSRSDTEVIPHAFEEYGADCALRFDGMFAVAVWDERARRLLLFRDRFGIKPLYYWSDRETFLFASEIRALLHDPTVPRRLNRQGAWDYMHIGCVCSPDTMFEGISKLPPAHCIEVKGGTVKTRPYWALHDAAPPDGHGTPQEIVRDLLEDSVRRHLIADVPLGIFLSGGVDSAGVTAAAVAANQGPVRAFTIGFPVERYDERGLAAETARFCGAEHETFVVEPDAMRVLRRVVERLEEPMADPAVIPLYYLCATAKEKVKVVLAGDGGDEIFGGYSRYYWDKWARAYAYVPRFLRDNLLARLAALFPERRNTRWQDFCRRVRKFSMTSGLPFAERYFAWNRILSPDMREDLLAKSFRGDGLFGAERIFLRLASEARTTDWLRKMQYIDLHTMLAERLLLKADKMSMAHSIELRVPYLDHRLAAYALRLPAEFKVHGLRMKRVLKEVLAGRVPPNVLAERKKGFRVPISLWFQGKLSDFASEALAEGEIRKLGLFDPRAVSRMLRLHRDGERDAEMPIYALMVLRLWHEVFMERRTV